jgi:hypothetical protein
VLRSLYYLLSACSFWRLVCVAHAPLIREAPLDRRPGQLRLVECAPSVLPSITRSLLHLHFTDTHNFSGNTYHDDGDSRLEQTQIGSEDGTVGIGEGRGEAGHVSSTICTNTTHAFYPSSSFFDSLGSSALVGSGGSAKLGSTAWHAVLLKAAMKPLGGVASTCVRRWLAGSRWSDESELSEGKDGLPRAWMHGYFRESPCKGRL